MDAQGDPLSALLDAIASLFIGQAQTTPQAASQPFEPEDWPKAIQGASPYDDLDAMLRRAPMLQQPVKARPHLPTLETAMHPPTKRDAELAPTPPMPVRNPLLHPTPDEQAFITPPLPTPAPYRSDLDAMLAPALGELLSSMPQQVTVQAQPTVASAATKNTPKSPADDSYWMGATGTRVAKGNK